MTDEEWEAIRKNREEDQKEDEKRSRVERQNSKNFKETNPLRG